MLACHGRAAITCEGLAALLGQALPPGLVLDVVVVDDASPDATAGRIAAAFPQVRLLRGDGQLWWAGAMALGLAAAAETAPDFLLWLNDDVRLDPDALARLIACHDGTSGDDGAISPVVVGATRDPDSGAFSYGGCRRQRRPLRFLPLPIADTVQPCDTFHGNIVLTPLSVYRQLNGIDPAFVGVQGMADTDFGLRAGAAGFPVLQAPGTMGTCRPNRRVPPWNDPALTRWQRLAGLFGPRGFPLRGWWTFARRHGGPFWPLWGLSPYLRRLWPALRPGSLPDAGFSPPAPKVALMDGVIAHYRVPVLKKLVTADGWNITVFHGKAPVNFRAVAAPLPASLPSRPVRYWAWPGGRRLAWSSGAWHALTGGYDIVVLEFCVHDLGVWLIWLVRQILGRPRVVLSGHFQLGADQPGFLTAVRRWLRVLLARGGDALLPYTLRGRDDCLAHGLDGERIFVTFNTLDISAIRAAAARVSATDLAAVRQRLRLPEGPVFLLIARFHEQKRVDLAIDAMNLLWQRGCPASLLIVGDGPERQKIETAAEGNPAIRLLPADFDEEQLAPLFMLSSAVVCPCWVGLVIVHAFAYGVPLIACANIPHSVEIDYLRSGVNGLLADAATPEALADALVLLVNQPGLLASLQDGARATADGMTIDTVVAANIAAYRRALDLPPSLPAGGRRS